MTTLSIPVPPLMYGLVKDLSRHQRLSMAEWVRRAINREVQHAHRDPVQLAIISAWAAQELTHDLMTGAPE